MKKAVMMDEYKISYYNIFYPKFFSNKKILL